MKEKDNCRQQPFRNLLDKIVSVKNKHEGELQSSGVNFNVFRILKLETVEVRLHSAFIGELLNPKGSHGFKDLFLKLFIKNLNIQEINLNEEISAEVLIEEYIRKKNLENTTGGRIDIVIKTENKIIVIENKIFASDQNKH